MSTLLRLAVSARARGAPAPPPPATTLLGVGSSSDSLSTYPKTATTTTGNWYVDPVNGSDSNAGTSVGAAFATLGRAFTSVTDGQTILVRAGTLTPSSRFIRSTSWATGINVWNYGTERPVLSASSLGSGSNSRILTLTGANEHWKGFHVRNVNQGTQAVYIDGSDYTLEDMWVSHCLGDGIYVANFGSGASDNVIQDCAVWRLGDGTSTGTNVPDCIVATGNTSTPTLGNRFVRCFAAHGPDDGIDLFRARGTRVIDSVVYRSGRYWNNNNAGDGNGYKMGGGDNNSGDNHAIGCLALACRANGFTHNEARNDTGTDPNIVFAFSTSVDNSGAGFDTGGDQTNHKNVFRDSIANGNGSVGYVGPNATEARTSRTLSISNPLFAATGSWDYSLASGSAAIGVGLGGDNLGASAIALEIAKEWLAKDLS